MSPGGNLHGEQLGCSRTILKRAVDVDVPPVSLDRRHVLARQIADAFRGAMHSGRLQRDDRVPATRTLASVLGVSRQVVVAAYEELTVTGHLRGRIGDGSYVAWAGPPCWVEGPIRVIVDPDGYSIRVSMAG
jgi:GntR family transcriptional regulator / MocR family aminotransferase